MLFWLGAVAAGWALLSAVELWPGRQSLDAPVQVSTLAELEALASGDGPFAAAPEPPPPSGAAPEQQEPGRCGRPPSIDRGAATFHRAPTC